MPFKSEAQRRFFHAATEPGFRGDADISKKDVAKWEKETPKNKELPERVSKRKKKMAKNAHFQKMAADLGRMHALEKRGGLLDSAITAAGRHAGWWAPAAGGAILAGPGYREEGALAGLLAGRLGLRAGRMAGAGGLKGGAKYFKGAPLSKYREAARSVGQGEAVKGLVTAKELPAAQQALQQAGLLGGVAGGALGGYGAGRLLGAQNPYGMQPVFPGLGKENPMGMRPA